MSKSMLEKFKTDLWFLLERYTADKFFEENKSQYVSMLADAIVSMENRDNEYVKVAASSIAKLEQDISTRYCHTLYRQFNKFITGTRDNRKTYTKLQNEVLDLIAISLVIVDYLDNPNNINKKIGVVVSNESRLPLLRMNLRKVLRDYNLNFLWKFDNLINIDTNTITLGTEDGSLHLTSDFVVLYNFTDMRKAVTEALNRRFIDDDNVKVFLTINGDSGLKGLDESEFTYIPVFASSAANTGREQNIDAIENDETYGC